jgi:ATP-binding cassette subfamily C protein EexD
MLDEPNSNLDEQGELALANTMQILKQDKATVFIISHRTAVLRHIDKLLVMKEGTVQMYGPRDQILAELAKQAQQKAIQKTA